MSSAAHQVSDEAAVEHPTSLRELKKSQTRQRLVDAALRLFAAQGYAQTSVEEIARTAQFGVTTFFRHFPTKEDVAFHDQSDMMREMPKALTGKSPDEIWPTVRDTMLGYLQAFQDSETGLDQIRRTLWLQEPAVTRRYAEICLRWENVVANVLADGLGLDPDREPYPRMAAAVLIASARAALWHQHRYGGSLVEYAHHCLAVLEPSLAQPPLSGASDR
ncbi:TetR family transcriptional regulator [Pseudonocardia eucalypti]|uniref:TetR family transcriptional regulator n=1 Tax=Pseudonocardia eucalypti TaxID=648755 RepID=A0ABP9QCU4_9PSEU|nr:AcrR family transcriptional regulator [Pseudonocardia eucalypti]